MDPKSYDALCSAEENGRKVLVRFTDRSTMILEPPEVESMEERGLEVHALMVVPRGALAYKYADPTEGGKWVFDETELAEIEAQDPSLLVGVV